MNDFAQEAHLFEAAGIHFIGGQVYLQPEWKRDFTLAMDAQPTLVSTPDGGIPAFLTTFVDPDVLRVLQAKVKAAEIYGEKKKGSWTDTVSMFPVIEHTGETSAYGDFNENGMSNANANFPQRENFLFQTIVKYGDLQLDRYALARISYASELKMSAVNTLQRQMNKIYFQGVQGIQNYGWLNDPGLNAPIAPAPKTAGGLTWFNGTAPNATTNEVYNDLLALITLVISQSDGNIDEDSDFTIGMSPAIKLALKFENSFGITPYDMLKENFPKIRLESAPQYGVSTAQNSEGNAAGNIVQVVASTVLGQETGFCAFSEKLRAHRLVAATSSYHQKMTSGCYGAVIRQPFAVATMIGV